MTPEQECKQISLRLAVLAKMGEYGSPEADRLRDRGDELWASMDEAARDRLRELSRRLNAGEVACGPDQ